MKRINGRFLLLGIAVLLLLVFVFSYNFLVVKEKSVERAWADVEAQYQRRLDLIPNLVETVRSYAKHERETFIKVTRARESLKKALSSNNISEIDKAGALLDKNIRLLFALMENYPDLKASQNFLALQDQLEGTENRISVARQRYNWAVQEYNRALRLFPMILIGKVLGFKEKPFFKSNKDAFNAVKVKF